MSGERVVATIGPLEAGPPDVGEKCVPSGYEATDMGLDLYFVLDHSFVLDQTEWNLLVFGLIGLFNSTEFGGMGGGFTVYPTPMQPPQSCVDSCVQVPGCNCIRNCRCESAMPDPQGICQCTEWSTSCDENDYATPAVGGEINRLRERQLQIALAMLPWPTGAPALRPVLLGSLQYRNEWEARNPGRRITQVLVAAARPFADCDDDRISDSEKVLSGPDKPKTYVAAVNDSDPDSVSDYNRLAAAGRTEQAIQITIRTRPPTPSPTNPFIELVRKIRANDGRCEYLLPSPSPELDYDKINLTASSGGLLYPRVPDRAACARNNQGWYYDYGDNPDQPARIVACDGACKSLHGQDAGQTSGSARIQLGCPTVLAADAGP